MCLFIQVYAFTLVCLYSHVYICTCMPMCIHASICICVRISVCVHLHIYLCMHTCGYCVCAFACVSVSMYECILLLLTVTSERYKGVFGQDCCSFIPFPSSGLKTQAHSLSDTCWILMGQPLATSLLLMSSHDAEHFLLSRLLVGGQDFCFHNTACYMVMATRKGEVRRAWGQTK